LQLTSLKSADTLGKCFDNQKLYKRVSLIFA